MATISRLSVSLVANTTKLRRGLRTARRSVKAFADRVISLKSTLVGALGAAAVGALAKNAVSAFEKQEQAVAKLDASIESMGRTTQHLSRDIQRLASEIQGEGIIGDEALIEGASFLSTYRDITDDMLPRTVRVMADLAAKMGGDTTRAANLLGKASMGLTGALSIAGISLSDATKESKDFKAILDEIEDQVGGTNKALGDTATGGLKQLSNAWGDLREVAGNVIAEVLVPGARVLTARISRLNIDVDSLVASSKEWFVTSLRGLGRVADAWNGILLVVETLKLGFVGFGALVTQVVAGIAKSLNRLGDFIGVDIVSRESVAVLEMALADQFKNIASIKKEISTLYDDVTTKKATREMQRFIDGVLRESKEIALDRGGRAENQFYPEPPPPPGVLHRLEVNQGNNPQIDATNERLDRIYGALTRERMAVAG